MSPMKVLTILLGGGALLLTVAAMDFPATTSGAARDSRNDDMRLSSCAATAPSATSAPCYHYNFVWIEELGIPATASPTSTSSWTAATHLPPEAIPENPALREWLFGDSASGLWKPSPVATPGNHAPTNAGDALLNPARPWLF